MLGWLYWDPSRIAFTMPFVGHPVAWYGVLFAAGFIIGYFLITSIFSRRLQAVNFEGDLASESTKLADRFTWLVVLGTLIGARLGHVFFYDWSRYSAHLWDILKVWEGGLASHGAAIAILLMLIVFRYSVRKTLPSFTWLAMLDSLVIPTALAGCLIRMGNFVNQEILGTPTQAPWAVVFGHPYDGGAVVPRHPVQLYEAFAYLLTFAVIWRLWQKRGTSIKEGVYSGLFFLLVFGSRFVLEYFKVPQTEMESQSLLSMGQWLSIPFVVLGAWLVKPSVPAVDRA